MAANSSCRKNRTVRFSYVDTAGTTVLTETAVTGPNGDYSVTLPKPTTTGPATVTLIATVDEAVRTHQGSVEGEGQEEGSQEEGQEVQLPQRHGADRAHG